MSDFFSGRSQGGLAGGLAGGLPSGVKLAAIALLVHQLMKHARSGSGAAPQESGGLGGLLGGLFGGGDPAGTDGARAGGQAPGPWGSQGHGQPPGPWGGQGQGPSAGPFGGLGGGLGGLVGAAAGGGLGGLLSGLGGLLGGLRGQGLGQHIDSWVGAGQNQPVSPQDLERSFDQAELDEAAQRAGTDRNTLLQELSAMLPQVVDRMTPQGHVPQREEELEGGGLDGLLSSLLGGDAGRRSDNGPGRR